MTRGRPNSPAARGARRGSRPKARAAGRASGRSPAARPTDDDDTAYLFDAHPGDSIDTSYILGRAFQLIAERWRHIASVLVASWVIGGLVIFGLVQASAFENSLWAAAGIGSLMHPAALIAMLLFWWAASLVLQAPLVGSAIEVHDDREGLFATMLQRALGSLPRLLGASALTTLIVVVVMAVALVLQSQVVAVAALMTWPFFQVVTMGIGSLIVAYLAIKMLAGVSLVVPVIVVEDLPVLDAVKRSWALGWRHGFAIVWAILLPTLLAELVLVPAGYMPGPTGDIIAVLLAIGLSLYSTAVVPVAYVAIREYTEGLHPGRIIPPGRR